MDNLPKDGLTLINILLVIIALGIAMLAAFLVVVLLGAKPKIKPESLTIGLFGAMFGISITGRFGWYSWWGLFLGHLLERQCF